MTQYLLDTNVLIYVAAQIQKVCFFLEDLDAPNYYISTISRLEFMVGEEGLRQEYIDHYLNDCINVPVTVPIVDQAAELFHKHKSLKFKDALIAATAMKKKLTLVTADRAFKKIKGLDVAFIKV